MSRIVEAKTPGDIAIVADLAHEIWTEHYVPIIGQAQVDYMLPRFQSPEAIAEQLGKKGYHYYLIRDPDQVSVGYLALIPNEPPGAMFLSKVYVRKSGRGKGLGKAMMAYAVTVSKEQGLSPLWLTVNRHNTGSIAAYERLGFVNQGSIVQDIGGGFVMDDYKMVHPLTDRDSPS
ncbi:MAG: GNAT family N-acetyltransferase [Lentisphaerae bacterium]|nr:GNAT family N-acetyltransferase [Lentisphaerota bacterium]MBT4818903.1 GNAT family N-acetyltransferase [Lentisphaerota bacterium]MBT5606100.1 GNAT family N-acetyltransferase [Lentisphaerota bacterium]MBT7058548.1 GNAT family N-acetyltransferase [Lentisphaerota bacterium]MBT7845782.1 GNAT family N-acetyltransferase [Lentisphaerota bacterium]